MVAKIGGSEAGGSEVLVYKFSTTVHRKSSAAAEQINVFCNKESEKLRKKSLVLFFCLLFTSFAVLRKSLCQSKRVPFLLVVDRPNIWIRFRIRPNPPKVLNPRKKLVKCYTWDKTAKIFQGII